MVIGRVCYEVIGRVCFEGHVAGCVGGGGGGQFLRVRLG